MKKREKSIVAVLGEVVVAISSGSSNDNNSNKQVQTVF